MHSLIVIEKLFLITFIFNCLLFPSLKANQMFHVEIESLILVMKKYNGKFSENKYEKNKFKYRSSKINNCTAIVKVANEKNPSIDTYKVNICNAELKQI